MVWVLGSNEAAEESFAHGVTFALSMRWTLYILGCLLFGIMSWTLVTERETPVYVAMNLAGHPDDEDGATMHYLRHARNAVVYSVIFTRGEGGQNEIGPELYEALGAIRTEETEAAARQLGTQVYYMNFEDFGFSKTAYETFEWWGGREHVTAELVHLIRRLRPDVIFTNHDTITVGPQRQHGHHQAVGLAAFDAFHLAADPAYRPDQLAEPGVEPWQPARLLLRRFRGGPSFDAALPVGDINPATGMSYAAGAADALGFHASQGMDLFAARLQGVDTMRYVLLRSTAEEDLPLSDFFAGLTEGDRHEPDVTYLIDSGRIAGAQFSLDDSLAVPGQTVELSWGQLPDSRLRWQFSGAIDTTLSLETSPAHLHVLGSALATRPAKVFQYRRQNSHPPVVYAAFREGEPQPVVAGYLPLEIAPPLFLETDETVVRLKPGMNEIPVSVQAFDRTLTKTDVGVVAKAGGATLHADAVPIALPGEGAARHMVKVPLPETLPDSEFVIEVSAGASRVDIEGRVFDVSVAPGLRVGLVRSYDNTLERALQELDVSFVALDSLDLAAGPGAGLHTVVVDIRSYLVRNDLRAHNDLLLDWVRRGGHLVVMYHKTFEWNGDAWPPYELVLGRDRVTLEDAPVRVLESDHPLVTWPNRIEAGAWDGWVQERGLYFPREWDPAYEELFCLSDPGESEHCGSTLLATVGQGTYLYTALAWYRQLKVYHPGAYAAFANMISLPLRAAPAAD